MKKWYSIYGLLAVMLTAVLAATVLTKAFFPAVILPKWNISNLTGFSLLVLLVDSLLAPGAGRNYGLTAALSVAIFGLLPWGAGVVSFAGLWGSGLSGGGVFTACTWLFSGLEQRLSSGNGSRMALLSGAVGIYLAVQAFTGIFP